MTLKDVAYVIAIAKDKSFSKAAEKLYISQPSLSQSINRLEKELGVYLFVRDNNRIIELTPACNIIVQQGTVLLQMEQQIRQSIHDIETVHEQSLRIGTSPFFNRYYMPKLLSSYRAQFPNVKLEIKDSRSCEIELDVIKGKLDIGLIPGPIDNQSLECEVILLEEIFFAIPAAHHLKQRIQFAVQESNILPSMDLSWAKDEKFIFLIKNRYSDFCMRLCRAAGFEPNIVFAFSTMDALSAYITAGFGVGFLPQVLYSSSPGKNNLLYCKMISNDNVKTMRPYFTIYKKKDRLTRAALNFIRVAKATKFMNNCSHKI
jgi:LysR family hydrogen peroxide-inducible transcriptional activator